MQRTLLILVAIAVLAGCETGLSRRPGETSLGRYQPYVGAPIQDFTAFSFDGWELVSPTQVIVWTQINRAYLITVWDSCQNLNFAQRIGIQATGALVTRLDSIRVGRERCPIQEIRPVDMARFRADRAAERAGQSGRHSGPALAP
jgi:hypothetical protein